MQGNKAKTVLIIEDEPEIMKFASKVLELEGYKLVQAEDASAGIKAIQENGVDVVLLDLMLPGEDGWVVLDQVKSDPKLSHIPVLVFTAAVQAANRDRAEKMGASDFITKPLTASQLKEAIDNIFNRMIDT